MDKMVLTTGVVLISKAFPSNRFDAEFFWEFLSDLENDDFTAAVRGLIESCREIYPGTNIIAAIRAGALEHKKTRFLKVPGIPDLRSDPPPAEWDELMRKLKS